MYQQHLKAKVLLSFYLIKFIFISFVADPRTLHPLSIGNSHQLSPPQKSFLLFWGLIVYLVPSLFFKFWMLIGSNHNPEVILKIRPTSANFAIYILCSSDQPNPSIWQIYHTCSSTELSVKQPLESIHHIN